MTDNKQPELHPENISQSFSHDYSYDSLFVRTTPLEKLDEIKSMLLELPAGDDIIPLMKTAVEDWAPSHSFEEAGTVISVGDGIATVSGLQGAAYGEILIFSGGIRGMVQELHRSELGCLILGDDSLVSQGSIVRRTGKMAGVPVGDEYLGRIINPLGLPIDGLGRIRASGYRLMESPAPGIIDRQPVNRPLETGLLAIDSMFPIGRGQRELIIGDRQTGKTAIALDTILNQKNQDVVCIYVAIGQKASSVARVVDVLKRQGALEYTIVVNAGAGDPVSLQYIAPYVGCAIGEYFMNSGRDVLIVYDDLSKHAAAYRTISLLLERSPGREAYPGDIFYLHSRLLERSAHLSDSLGGGSMTALPIVETQAGDVSAYIPTNIISITDGQIFLESELFFSGQRPAVNVGLSVSRVGGDAQTSAMKKAAGPIRLELAQYREMEVFTQFSSDLDDATKEQLKYGQGLMELLRQDQYHPLESWKQVVLLHAAMSKAIVLVPRQRIKKYADSLLGWIELEQIELKDEIVNTGALSKESSELLRERIKEYTREFLAE